MPRGIDLPKEILNRIAELIKQGKTAREAADIASAEMEPPEADLDDLDD
ncbi:MAG: hypothetical protein IT318_24150 [Anaerolineales bacterium]|nr:hypothetical protein [Anaerolineales bacterium]